MSMIPINPRHTPELDPQFIPAKLWNVSYLDKAAEHPHRREVGFQIQRPDGTNWTFETRMLPAENRFESLNHRYAERLTKALLWAWGGPVIEISGAPEVVRHLQSTYSDDRDRAFDYEFLGDSCFRQPLEFVASSRLSARESDPPGSAANRELGGCRIGFDLGGSDRKCAALIDGEVVYSEEIPWDPYFQSDPNYHLEGIRDSIARAAAKLPRVDAIGGSAAGIYIENEPRVASLFRGIDRADFDRHIRHLFHNLQQEWGNVPFVVANDGDVTALAGAMSLNVNAVLGISMGTSEAAGYVDSSGRITGKLNELAFVPVDYRVNAPVDEWSGDMGCGAQYFSQQAVGRLISAAGIDIRPEMPLPEKLEDVQAQMKLGDERAAAIYQTIGVYFGYSLAHYADYYPFRHLLFLGRVSSGDGGRIIQETAETVLADEFPELAGQLSLSMPDEKMKRHGQAIAAASLPTLEHSKQR